MLVDGFIVAIVLVSLLGALALRRRSHDDVHSVEGYHRQIHTLEVINEHQDAPEGSVPVGSEAKHAYPESAVRVTGSTTVRLIGPDQPPAPPMPPVAPVAPPPLSKEPIDTVTFEGGAEQTPETSPTTGWPQDPAVNTMNRRPRRLAAPAAAIAAVTVLIVVLLITGSHTVAPLHHAGAKAHTTGTTTHHATTHHATTHHATTPTTAPPPIVSAPQTSTANAATYQVGTSTYTLVLSATNSSCWMSVSSTTGAGLFSGTLTPGESHTVPVTGPITIDVGAPSSFAATVNGTPVVLPTGFQTPLTLNFTSPAAAAAPPAA